METKKEFRIYKLETTQANINNGTTPGKLLVPVEVGLPKNCKSDEALILLQDYVLEDKYVRRDMEYVILEVFKINC